MHKGKHVPAATCAAVVVQTHELRCISIYLSIAHTHTHTHTQVLYSVSLNFNKSSSSSHVPAATCAATVVVETHKLRCAPVACTRTATE
jgi:hypothetical protein